MTFGSKGYHGYSRVEPNSFEGMGSLGAWGAPAPPVYEKSLPTNLSPNSLSLIEDWISTAIPMMAAKLPKENYGWGGANKVISPHVLWTLATGAAPTAEEMSSGTVYKKFKETAYFYPNKAIRWALNGFVSRVLAWPMITNFGARRPDISPAFAVNAVRYVPAPPWYKATRFYWGLVEEVQADGFFRNTKHEGADMSIFLVAWSPARFWWKVPDGAIPNTNSTAGGALIKGATNWGFNRANAEWMFPPIIWEQISRVSTDRWKLNTWAESGDLRLEFHQRRYMPYQGAGSNDPAGWFPYPIIRKQGYDIIVDSLPSAQDYQDWVDWYNSLPIMADPRNKLALRVEVVDAKTGEAVKLNPGEEKVLIVIIAWNTGVTEAAKAAFIRKFGMVKVPLPEVDSDANAGAYGVVSFEGEEQLDDRIMADPEAGALISDLAVHPIYGDMAAKAASMLAPTKTIIRIYGPAKDKKEPSFMKQYGIYIAAGLVVAGAALAIAGVGSAGAAGGVAASTSAAETAALTAAGTGAANTAGGVAGAGLAAGGGEAAGAGLLATAGKSLAAPALKYGIATAMGSEEGQQAAMREVMGAVTGNIAPMLATEVLPDGVIQLTSDARTWLDTYVPAEVQDIAEAYLSGKIKREVAETIIRNRGYEMPEGFDHWVATGGDQPDQSRRNVGRQQPITMGVGGWGAVAGVGALLLTAFLKK